LIYLTNAQLDCSKRMLKFALIFKCRGTSNVNINVNFNILSEEPNCVLDG